MAAKAKRALLVIAIVIACIAALALINSIPTWNLETPGMTEIEGPWANVYYETEKEAAEDVYDYAQGIEDIANKLGFYENPGINVYVYDSQATMQSKKYGFIAPLLGLDWYIGDNIGTNVILTSPANPGPAHSYDDVALASLHEIVHAYVSVINPHVSLWLTEGVALYLTNGEPLTRDYLEANSVPSFEDTRTRNPLRFNDCGGYQFAHTYIEYLDETYGWDKVLELLATEDYESVFGKSQRDIYDEWVAYLYATVDE
jgi:hypothetical protein